MRYVVFSTTKEPDYAFYAPIVAKAWKELDYIPVCFFSGYSKSMAYAIDQIEGIASKLPEYKGHKTATIMQMVRLYAACLKPIKDNDFILTSDVDMLPLSRLWFDHLDNRVLLGGDLLSFQEIPMCYIGMSGKDWKKVMMITNNNIEKHLARDIAGIDYSHFDGYWYHDQKLITRRIQLYGMDNFHVVSRGYDGGFPKGRIDRGNWQDSKNRCASVKIDSHLLRPGHTEENYPRIRELIAENFPQMLNWLDEYREKYVSYL